MIIYFIALVIFRVSAQGFSEADLFMFSDGIVREELDYEQANNKPPYYMKIRNNKLQVSPSEIQTENADFSFTFNLYLDMGINKTAFIKIDFREYFNDLR